MVVVYLCDGVVCVLFTYVMVLCVCVAYLCDGVVCVLFTYVMVLCVCCLPM